MQRVVLNWHKQHRQNLTPGERAADKMRNGMGSWRFVFIFLAFMAAWAWLNTNGSWHH